MYVGVTWEYAPVFSTITEDKTNGLFAALSLAGMHTCSSETLNGYGGYSNWEVTFLQDLTVSDLSPYTIVDFDIGSTYETDYGQNNSVNAAAKYLRAKYEYDIHVANPGNRSIIGNLFSEDQASFNALIIIIASSLSLISITALSILLVKKRKRTDIS